MAQRCECEHHSHAPVIGDDWDEAERNHPAPDRDVQDVRTIYGTFAICGYCREDHPIPSDLRADD